MKRRYMIYYVIFCVLMIVTLANKKNLHIDETFSYGLSNHHLVDSYFMTPESGKKYVPAETPWLEYMSVQPGNQFDYGNVWRNQAVDTHPPIYYMILHTICSFFPGKFSIWFAGAINIVSNLLLLFIAQKMCMEMTKSKYAIDICSIMLIFSSGILSLSSFLRMYSMIMLWVLMLSYLIIYYLKRQIDRKFYALLFALSTTGALIHYYFVIYLFFACTVLGLYLLITRKYKKLLGMVISLVLSAGMAIIIFPKIISHTILSKGNRGKETIDNFKNVSILNWKENLKAFGRLLNQQVFGGTIKYVFLLFFVLLVVALLWKAKGKTIFGNDINKDILLKNIFLLVPCIFYFLIVSKIAVYVESRYISLIYAVIIVVVACDLTMAADMLPRKIYSNILMCCFAAVIIVGNVKNCSWDYLYLDSEAFLNKTKEYSSQNCVVVCDSTYPIQPAFFEASNYRSVTIIKDNNLAQIDELEYKEDKNLVVCVAVNVGDVGAVLDYIIDKYPYIDAWEEIGSYNATITYYLYGNG